MSTKSDLQPYIDPDPQGMGGSPHLSDYWTVIARRLWLVLVIFTVTTASSIWAISRQQTYYSSSTSLQVNDPQERQAGLVQIPRMGGVNLFVDPIVSEIQVLNSSAIKNRVVDSLGMRLRRVPPTDIRSEVMRAIHVAPDATDGFYRLIYNADDTHAQFLMPDGTVLEEAEAGRVLDVGFLRFVLQRAPAEQRVYELQVVPRRTAAGEIDLSAVPRVDTNIVDVSFVHQDPFLVPDVLNQAGLALIDRGAERVRQAARLDAAFIQAQLDTASTKLRQSRNAIRDFKTTQAFTSLGIQDRNCSIAPNGSTMKSRRGIANGRF